MRWRGRRQSDNIEDRRGQGGGFGRGFGRGSPQFRIPIGRGRTAGGGSISGIIILVVVFIVLRFLGIDVLQLLDGIDGTGSPQVETASRTNARDDVTKQFVATVLAETEDVWKGVLQARGGEYREPTLVLFSGQVQSACGYASAASGPFYCPQDQKAYIDLSFYDELARRFGASGDFAQAYVLAHEIGHHVQNLTGILPAFHRQRQSMGEVEANRMSVRVELQADCFAGIWAHYTGQKGLLEKGDIDEALNAAHQIGDDTLQRRTQGYVVPESFNHGTSAQRAKWFRRGFDTGRFDACDTFGGPI